MSATICDLATTLPVLIGTLLDQEARLKKGRFREETLTDIFTASLATFAGPELVIEYPDEAATGSDIDLEFWHAATGQHMLVRLQAKRLNAQTNAGKPVAIAYRSYRELMHKVPSSGKLQFQTLVEKCGDHLPLYLFYNHRSVTNDAHFAGKLPAVQGINLAFAHDIANELEMKIVAARGTPSKLLNHKRLSHLQPHLFGLDALLCGGTEPGGLVPTPDAVRQKLAGEWQRPRRKEDRATHAALRYLFQPSGLLGPSFGERRIVDGPPIRFGADVERTTLTFISGRTDDDRTPRIVERDWRCV